MLKQCLAGKFAQVPNDPVAISDLSLITLCLVRSCHLQIPRTSCLYHPLCDLPCDDGRQYFVNQGLDRRGVDLNNQRFKPPDNNINIGKHLLQNSRPLYTS